MPADPDRVQAVFLAAVEAADPAACLAVLDRECGADAELRQRVEVLLEAHDAEASLLDGPALAGAIGTDPANSTDTIAHPSDAERVEQFLTFLQPSTRTDSLGRLGHYEVLEVLGRGGFGIVFRAADEMLQRVVAIKVLSPQLAATSPARKRFLREARSSARVRHGNVVQVYAVEEQPLPYLVMEFIPGETLQQRLDRIGPLEAAEVVHVGRQIAEGLAAAHAQGLIHRDVKPANVLIEAGPHQHVKITDFGLARAADDASMTQSGVVAGTPMFMAPEQVNGDRLDLRADLFSLGSVLYTMCSGRPPFRANSTLAVLKRVAEDTPRPIQEIIPEVPTWLCGVISRLHAKNPEDRFASAQEVADLLVETSTMRSNPEAAPANGPRSRIGRWTAVAAGLLLLLGGLGLTEATGVTKVSGTVVRLFSPEGTLVVEVDDPDVSIQVDGSDLVIKGAGAKEIRLKPGRHVVEALKDGKVVRRDLVTVEKNGRRVVRVSQEAPPDEKAARQKQDPDRIAAEYVLHVGGKVRVNGGDSDLRVAADLPDETFRLTSVNLDLNKRVSDASLAHFKDCKNLTTIRLHHTRVGDAGMAHLAGCKNLTQLLLAGTEVSDAGLVYFKDCKSLTRLHLSHAKKVQGTGLMHLEGCDLTQIELAESQVSDESLARLEKFEKLTFLNLCGTEVGNAGLAHLGRCKNLTHLILTRTKVDAAGIDALKKKLPKCTITWQNEVRQEVEGRVVMEQRFIPSRKVE